MNYNDLGLVLRLELGRVSSRVKIKVKDRVCIMARFSIKTSRVVNFALFCY